MLRELANNYLFWWFEFEAMFEVNFRGTLFYKLIVEMVYQTIYLGKENQAKDMTIACSFVKRVKGFLFHQIGNLLCQYKNSSVMIWRDNS